jgi:pimeloyl-ACP methyl ester carboxylesterase
LRRPTIVLLHGAGGSLLSWPVNIRRLPGYRVLALDLPGHGKSGGIAFQKTEDYQLAMTRFLREVGVFSMVIVGHSLGSAIAMKYTMNNPDQVKGLVLLSAAVRFSIPADIFQTVADAETYPIGLSFIRQRFFSPGTPVRLRNRIMSSLEKQRSTILYSDFLSASDVDFKKSASLIVCPSLIACGKQDLITPPTICRKLGNLIHDAEFIDIPAAGHMLPLEQPAAVTNGLRHFLEKHNHFIPNEDKQ